MNLELNGQRVLITGGSKGIGLAIAQAFAAEGARPVLVSRDRANLAHAVQAIEAAHHIIPEVFEADLSLPGSADKLCQQVGDIDVLVNNAGAIPGGSIHDITEERWRQAWELKLYSYINLTRAYWPSMEKRGKGVIANIIGMAGAAPRNAYICGSTANAALMAFTQALGASSQLHGVRVFGINPSPTKSERMEGMLRAQAAQKWSDPERWMELTVQMPFGRMAEPQEIADLTTFCCSPLSSYLTGSVINVDGGQMFA